MNHDLHRWRLAERGFTLMEVLIASLIVGIALTAAFAVFINHNKNHVIQAGVTEMQQNGRAAIDELVSSIRKAGYKLPTTLEALQSWDSNPDTIEVAALHEPECNATLSDPMSMPSSELRCSASDLSCFSNDMWVYICEEAVDSGEFVYITGVAPSVGTLQHTGYPLTRMYNTGSKIYVVDFCKYFIDNSDTSHPVLVRLDRDGQEIYADNIEDMNFQYTMADGTISDTVSVARYVREVLITLTARTERNDLFVGNDRRRETYTTRVRVRNL